MISKLNQVGVSLYALLNDKLNKLEHAADPD